MGGKLWDLKERLLKRLTCIGEDILFVSSSQPFTIILYSFCCRSFIYFRRAKVAKRPARGKISQALLCSGIAAQYPSVEKPLPLELTFCFTALRNLCGMVL